MQSFIRKTSSLLRNPLPISSHFARFHSTPVSLDNSTHIRFSVREKRGGKKKDLKDFLLHGKSSKDEIGSRKSRAKNNSRGSSNSRGGKQSGSKRGPHKKHFRNDDEHDDEHPASSEATFGGQRCYNWSFTWQDDCHSNNSTSGFQWRDESNSEKTQRRVWSESDFDDEPTPAVDYSSHRVTLGLPPTGFLKLEDIKFAFRASALKWHPDKHHGPSQATAEEKFKLCVDAYASLCNAMKSR